METNRTGGFGRRSDSLSGIDRAQMSQSPEQGWRPSWRQVLSALAAIVLGAIIADGLLSGTSLITPVNETFLYVMGLAGFVLGIPLAIATVLKPHKPMGLGMKILIVLFLPAMTWFSGMMLAWRIADWKEFAFSSEPFVEARYPVTYQSPSTRFYKYDAFEIDPFDTGGTDIPVPSDQFDAVFPHGSDMCITVLQRQSPSGAIEIRTDGVLNLSPPAPVKLTPCPEALADDE